jgi:hypothetical protein
MESTSCYRSLREFYPFYLSQHLNPMCRRLHFIGMILAIFSAMHAALTANWILLALVPVWVYGFAWVGHFVFEKNRPATFQYPFYSLASDFIMFGQLLTGQLEISSTPAEKLPKNAGHG